MRVGYIRVSTEKQNLDRQLAQMEKEKVEKIFQDKMSGKNTDRPEFQKMLDFVHEEDEIVVSSLDRLGRNYDDIRKTVALLAEKKVKFSVLDAPFLSFDTGNNLLDTAMQDMFLSLLSYIAQNEREKILERQRQGIQEAKKRGIYKGKPLQYTADSPNASNRVMYEKIVSLLKENVPIAGISRETNVHRNTIYRIKNELKRIEEISSQRR